jgi:hypothetical protein
MATSMMRRPRNPIGKRSAYVADTTRCRSDSPPPSERDVGAGVEEMNA